jgi:hypothetical protein
MAHRIASSLAFSLAVLAHAGCYDAESTDDGGPGAGGSSGASAGSGGAQSGSSGTAGSQAGSSPGSGGSAGSGGTTGGSAGQDGSSGQGGNSGESGNGAGNADSGGAPGEGGAGGAGEGGEPSSGGATGEGGSPAAGSSGSAGDASGSAGDASGSGGDPGAGGEAGRGDAAGSGGSAGGDAGPSCSEGNVPLVWILLSTSSGMFGETLIGPNEAWGVIRSALTGPDGALADLDGRASVGLTLFGGVAAETCPSYFVVEPSTDTTAVATAIDTVAPPVAKNESPLPAAYAATLEQVRARPETDKTIVIIANSVPDFCNDGAVHCPRDTVVSEVQEAFDDGVRTLLVGVDHPFDANADERQAYFQAVANAGSGYVPEIFGDRLMIEASCLDGVLGEYGTASQQASWVLGTSTSTTFTSELQQRMVALGCP